MTSETRTDPNHSGTDLYGDDGGAELYDIAFDWRRHEEADFAEACLRRYGPGGEGNALLDVACGGGQFLQEMHSRGWRVAGVDLSSAMIARARRRLPNEVPLEVACMSEFTLAGPFDIVTCWCDSVRYLLTNEAIIRHLQRVGRALKPGGVYVVDVGFSSWAHPMWCGAQAAWRPDFSGGWSASRGIVEVYHDGDDGPPCEAWPHLCTEYMYFRVSDRATGAVAERTYLTRKRALHPQEFAALVSASAAFECAAWFAGAMDLSQPFETTDGRGRALVVLRAR
jgi:SAM-dependent methyltransferase